MAKAGSPMVGDEKKYMRSETAIVSHLFLDQSNNIASLAFLGSHLSVFNDVWCTSPSVLTHETGHNLRLRHAHENGIAYGDITGLMGTSFL